jgi:glycosyltransferase involved in cell wall biosynthesis
VVHSQVGGAAELIETGRNGLLFPAGDTAALVECLRRLCDRDTRLRMGCNARRTAEAAFGEERMVDRYEQLLLELCGSTGAVTVRA